MAKTLNVSLSISGEAVNVSNARLAISNNALRRYELPTTEFAALASNKEILAPIDLSTASVVVIQSTTGVTLKTNSTGLPGDTKTLTAGQGIVWWDGCGFALADYFTADITAMYFTNLDADVAGAVTVIILDDATV